MGKPRRHPFFKKLNSSSYNNWLEWKQFKERRSLAESSSTLLSVPWFVGTVPRRGYCCCCCPTISPGSRLCFLPLSLLESQATSGAWVTHRPSQIRWGRKLCMCKGMLAQVSPPTAGMKREACLCESSMHSSQCLRNSKWVFPLSAPQALVQGSFPHPQNGTIPHNQDSSKHLWKKQVLPTLFLCIN